MYRLTQLKTAVTLSHWKCRNSEQDESDAENVMKPSNLYIFKCNAEWSIWRLKFDMKSTLRFRIEHDFFYCLQFEDSTDVATLIVSSFAPYFFGDFYENRASVNYTVFYNLWWYWKPQYVITVAHGSTLTELR
jgi:hypothetical protein